MTQDLAPVVPTELPELPKGYLVMMSPDPEAMPAEWFDAADMQAYAHKAVAEATSKLNALIGMQHTQLVAAEQRLAAHPQQGWISVEERLPEDPRMRCLVHYGWAYDVPMIGIAQLSSPWKGQMLWSGHSGSHNQVTHWMPLPEPPGIGERSTPG